MEKRRLAEAPGFGGEQEPSSTQVESEMILELKCGPKGSQIHSSLGQRSWGHFILGLYPMGLAIRMGFPGVKQV